MAFSADLLVLFTNNLTPRAKYPKGYARYKKTLVKEGVSIGANATIACGYTVRKIVLIAAGAVVMTNVPDYAFMAGIPARQIRAVDEYGNIIRKSEL